MLRVERLADSLGHTGGFSGVVLIEKDGAVVFERAYGVADSAAHRMNDPKTRFDVSSVGKLFTQTAVQQLIEAGRMHPDSTIGAYWPDYPNPDVAHRVTPSTSPPARGTSTPTRGTSCSASSWHARRARTTTRISSGTSSIPPE